MLTNIHLPLPAVSVGVCNSNSSNEELKKKRWQSQTYLHVIHLFYMCFIGEIKLFLYVHQNSKWKWKMVKSGLLLVVCRAVHCA